MKVQHHPAIHWLRYTRYLFKPDRSTSDQPPGNA